MPWRPSLPSLLFHLPILSVFTGKQNMMIQVGSDHEVTTSDSATGCEPDTLHIPEDIWTEDYRTVRTIDNGVEVLRTIQ